MKGVVTCLKVDGQSAAFVTRITKSRPDPSPVGRFFVVHVFDSGQPFGQGDLLSMDGPFNNEVPCPAPSPSEPILEGNIVVHDASP